MNREEWLSRAAARVRTYGATVGVTIPVNVRVSIGFPSRGGLSSRSRRVGECWNPASSADGHFEVFISPTISDSDAILEILAHELAHSATPKAGHKGAFQKAAAALGLAKPWTATTWAGSVAQWAQETRTALGDFPHAALSGSNRKKQGTRMLKLTCPGCDYTVRTTAKWLEVGFPTCCCGEEFQAS